MKALELSLTRTCPVLCDYCPQDVLRKASKGATSMMTVSDARAVLRNAMVDRAIVAGYTEPTKNPDWLEIVQACCELSGWGKLHTSGWMLSEADVKGLSKMPNLDVHIHVTKNGMERLAKVASSIVELLPNATWGAFSRSVWLEAKSLMRADVPLLYHISRGGNLADGIGGVTGVPVKCHAKMGPHWMPVIVPGGDAYACCNDYGLEMPIGNLVTQSWDELGFSRIIEKMKDPSNGLPCHRGCDRAIQIDMPDGGFPSLPVL